MSNQVAIQNNKAKTVKTVETLMANNDVKTKFNEVLGKKAPGFIASVISASKNDLKDVEPSSILKSAMTAATLDLPIEQNLGFAYIVPYNKKINGKWIKQAQFQMGTRGYIQLAIRTGQYEILHATEVYEGEIKKIDRLTGEVIFNEDYIDTDNKEIVGYLAHFRLINGFKKTVYMTKEEMEKHAKKYSKSYNNKNPEIVKSSIWTTDFNSMALKTVMKRLLSKYGILSIEMQKAILSDQAIIDENDNLIYADNPTSIEHEINEKANQKIIDAIDAEAVEVEGEVIEEAPPF